MCGKYQKWRQNLKTPNSEKWTRGDGRGGGWVWVWMDDRYWQAEHCVLLCMWANWTPIKINLLLKKKKKKEKVASGWLSHLSFCLRLRAWSSGPGIESTSGFLQGPCFSLCLCLCLSLSFFFNLFFIGVQFTNIQNNTQCPSPIHSHPPPSSPSTTPSSFPRVSSLYVLSPFLIFPTHFFSLPLFSLSLLFIFPKWMRTYNVCPSPTDLLHSA